MIKYPHKQSCRFCYNIREHYRHSRVEKTNLTEKIRDLYEIIKWCAIECPKIEVIINE